MGPSRDLTFVSDTCEAYFEILKTKKFLGQVINVGSRNEHKIEDIAKKIISKINPDAKITTDKKRIRPSNSEVERLVCNNELISINTDILGLN